MSPSASSCGPSSNLPSRIFGPCRSTSTATGTPGVVRRLPHVLVDALVDVVGAVAEVHARDVDARIDDRPDLLVARCRRPEGGDDLRSSHVLCAPVFRAVALGRGRATRRRRARGLDREGAGVRRDRARQFCLAFKVPVDGGGRSAALGDRPDDERLPATGVAGDEHAGLRRGVVAVAGDVAAVGRPAAAAARRASRVSGPVKPRASSTRSAGISRSVPAFGTRRPSRYSVSATRMARTSPTSLARNSTVDARYWRSSALLVGALHLEDGRMHRPRLVARARLARLLADREVGHREGALAVRRADAVGPGVAAAEDDDVLALRGDLVEDLVAGELAVRTA